MQGGHSHISEWSKDNNFFRVFSFFSFHDLQKTQLSFSQLDSFQADISSKYALIFLAQFGLDTSVRWDCYWSPTGWNTLTDLDFWWKFSHLQIDTFASCKQSLTVAFPKGIPASKHISSSIWGFDHKEGHEKQQKQTQHFIWQIFTKKWHPASVAAIPQ